MCVHMYAYMRKRSEYIANVRSRTVCNFYIYINMQANTLTNIYIRSTESTNMLLVESGTANGIQNGYKRYSSYMQHIIACSFYDYEIAYDCSSSLLLVNTLMYKVAFRVNAIRHLQWFNVPCLYGTVAYSEHWK